MRDDPSVVALVTRAARGDQAAWNEIVERYAPLVWSICLRYQLDRQDIDDIGQSVWLLLIENIGNLREPAALPGWLAKTTQNECLRVLRTARRREHAVLPPEDQLPTDPDAVMIEEEILLAERNAALRAAFAELPRSCRDLLYLLMRDEPGGYSGISAVLRMPIGSIGPMRGRCLGRLRQSPHLAALAGTAAPGTGLKQARDEHGE
jgi:RNA polymerase sigma factor (sigma-70 family)